MTRYSSGIPEWDEHGLTMKLTHMVQISTVDFSMNEFTAVVALPLGEVIPFPSGPLGEVHVTYGT